VKVHWEKFAAVLFACAVLQGSLLFFIEVENCTPDLFLLLVIFLALYADKEQALLCAWIAGLARDISSAGRLGFHALLFMGAAFLIIRVRDEIYKEEHFTRMFLVFFVTMGLHLVAVFYARLFFGYRISSEFALSILLLSVYNLVAVPVMVPLFEKIRMLKRLQA